MSHPTDDFYPETIEIINVAIEDAWREVQNGGGPLTRPAYARITRAVIAKRITEMAKKGERDRRKLSEHGVRSVILNQQRLTPAKGAGLISTDLPLGSHRE